VRTTSSAAKVASNRFPLNATSAVAIRKDRLTSTPAVRFAPLAVIARARGQAGLDPKRTFGSADQRSLDYSDKTPFKFNGKIEQVHVKYVT